MYYIFLFIATCGSQFVFPLSSHIGIFSSYHPCLISMPNLFSILIQTSLDIDQTWFQIKSFIQKKVWQLNQFSLKDFFEAKLKYDVILSRAASRYANFLLIEKIYFTAFLLADAKRTPSYSSDLHFLGIIMQLSDLKWLFQSDLPKS